jgi:predicted alpha/beta-fold hydrolase
MGQITQSAFRPAWWLPGGHLQTLWPTFFRHRPPLPLTPERVELADGDFLDLAWTRPNGGPVVVVIHGLEGSLHSHYARTTLAALHGAGLRPVFMHLRGCSTEPNRLDRSYHSGASDDLAAVIAHVRDTHGAPPDGAVGFSLGGNLLLKYLGESGAGSPLRAAVAVSVPYRLLDCARRLDRGFSRIYRRHLVTRLQNSYLRKFNGRPAPLSVDVTRLDDFYSFDDSVTAPLNGFDGAADYYARCSSRDFVAAIHTPTLLLHALDDPFMTVDTPPAAGDLGPGVTLELSRGGGHVGFVSGTVPGRAEYWLDRRIAEFLRQKLTGFTQRPLG